MKHFTTLILVLLTCLICAAWPQAVKPMPRLKVNARIPQFPRKPSFAPVPQIPERVGSAISPAAASSGVTWVQCPPEAEGFGLPVPVSYTHLTLPTIYSV